jgi:transcriptional regulator with XRE-family HTH domain
VPRLKVSEDPQVMVNHHVAMRIRQRRIALGMTQKHLAETIGITSQQVHKYELGANRISVGALHRIALALDVEAAFFFDGLDRAVRPPDQSRIWPTLAHDFVGISEPRHQRALLRLARVMAGSDGDDDRDHGQDAA